MNDLESFWDLIGVSDDAVLILENGVLVRCNKSAAELMPDIDIIDQKQFSLALFSPKFQPCGKLSVEQEEESRKIAVNKGYERFEWVLLNPDNENYFAEVTLLHSDNEGISLLLIILRSINRQEQNLRTLERQRKEIIQKNEEIKIQGAEIELQKEQFEIQRDLAEKQRDEIAVQKKALIDSIRYASRIQSALLPDNELIDSVFSEFFILNKPKDILSGDFYWFSEKNGKIVIAVADCTGHGVPGALLSVLGMKFLDEIVNGTGTTQPDRILNHLRERIIQSIGQTGKPGGTNDGMDIALLSIDMTSSTLHFAGALNPIFIIKNNSLREIKGDRLPLGMQTGNDKPYTNHKVLLEPHDSIYLFSDGYADQFGWRTNKKFNLTNFRELIVSIQDVPMKAQKILLENNLKNWMGDLEQIDDIMVVGLQI